MAPLLELDAAADAYDRLAPFYDDFTAGYPHDAWIDAVVEQRAAALGLRGHRALDIACGTGKSTDPSADPRLFRPVLRHLAGHGPRGAAQSAGAR